ncbi:MAG: hypothetical protein IKE16_02340 [Solobacterium sp.]|nr:hypothetical protein [Solobacterium sp.]MBR2793459.1 hypothetical protein [Solobacterium sp.]
MKQIIPLLLCILLFGCSTDSAYVPSSVSTGEQSPDLPIDSEILRQESQKLFRTLFPNVKSPDLFFYGTAEDAEMVITQDGRGIILLGEEERKKSAEIITVLESLKNRNFTVLFVNAQKEKYWDREAWKSFTDTVRKNTENGQGEIDDMVLPVLLFVKKGNVVGVMSVPADLDPKTLEQNMEELAEQISDQ